MEAFGPKKKNLVVVTAPSSAYRYCMRVFFEDASFSSAELVRCQCWWWVKQRPKLLNGILRCCNRC